MEIGCGANRRCRSAALWQLALFVSVPSAANPDTAPLSALLVFPGLLLAALAPLLV